MFVMVSCVGQSGHLVRCSRMVRVEVILVTILAMISATFDFTFDSTPKSFESFPSF